MKPKIPRLAAAFLCPLLLATSVNAAPDDDKKSRKEKQSENRKDGGGRKAEPKRAEKKSDSGKTQAKRDERKPERRENQQAKREVPKPRQETKGERKSPSGPIGRKDLADRKEEPKETARTRGGGGKANEKSAKQDRKDIREDQDTARGERIGKRRVVELPGKRPQVKARGKARELSARDRRFDRMAKERRAEDKAIAKALKRDVRPGRNTRKIRRPEFAVREGGTAWWSAPLALRDGRRDRGDKIIVIDRHFRNNVNWNTRRDHWGYNPWWNRRQTRPWYASTWSSGWNRDYYRTYYPYRRYHGHGLPGYSAGVSIGWGLIGWSLGSMVYDLGYRSYSNPYDVDPFVYDGGEINYRQPITRVAVRTAPADDAMIVRNTVESETFIADSQAAFKRRDYLVALELADKAIVKTPGDGALHEYRALILFALGKYTDAAGILNPVLASGPGWDSETMLALYDSEATYTAQLNRLEEYSEKNDSAAAPHFLLGYHYMVTGHLDLAETQFDRAYELEPKDQVARQLAALARSSSNEPEAEIKAAEAEEDTAPAPEPVPLDKLTGTWTSKGGDGGPVKLTFSQDGKFIWIHDQDGGAKTLQGEYSMNDDGMLVLESDETQMVADVSIEQDSNMNFVLAGGPPEDPGLDFTKG